MVSSILAAGLIQAFLELTLYGVYFVVFSTVVYLFRRRTRITQSPMIFVVLAVALQFCTITAHWINTMHGTYLPFVELGGGVEAEKFYHTLGTGTLKIHVILSELTNSITDCLVIHRLYVVWDYRLTVVAVPLLFLAAQIASGIGVIHGFFVQSLENYRAASIGWVTTNLISALVISVYCTGMITWKIVSVNGTRLQISSHSIGRRHLRVAFIIVIESAALQTTMNLALLVAFHCTTTKVPNFILKGIQAVVLGLSTVLVLARGLGWTQSIPAAGTNPTTVSFTLDDVRTLDTEAPADPYVRK
ncbi:hypothetical protein MSAN_00676500 [Mycena sanguinolenta]|uniref:Uncharacterized protein n=1 Tax=Mycena sanguinolenta TaxID=230812 RepID=A0A8H6Z1E1_9AGAR|nr:hypothetical protein MSAN_00676500 [Mycena sanguinolenta]